MPGAEAEEVELSVLEVEAQVVEVEAEEKDGVE